jgi:hypothetical protein
MSALPGRPNLDQLRHQARELHRAASSGDEASVRRVREVSASLTLSAAQLAIAREYGFASWPKLRAEVARRRAAADDARRDQPGGSPKSWREMREWCVRLLRSRTGQDVADWDERIAAEGLDDEQSLRAWLADRGVTGYAQALLVWERFGYPEFLIADAEQLIGKQYADRPQLRPILDAVLAALPALGPVTVQARGTYVSLVSPRRTFAVVQATTKSRVDLGLRLAGVKPEGRLREAKNVGQATVRIPLSTPDEVDEEVLDWLRRTYEENTAPPMPRSARRQARKLGSLTVVIEGSELPGLTCRPEPEGTEHRNIHVALFTQSKEQPTLVVPSNPWLATEPVPGDSLAARWEVPVTVRQGDDGYDFSGPFVRGVRDDRHLGLAWGELPGDGTLQMFRGAKLRLVDVPPSLIAEAMRPEHRLVARVRLTDAKGNPVCARLHPPYIAWSAEPSAPVPDHDHQRRGAEGGAPGGIPTP